MSPRPLARRTVDAAHVSFDIYFQGFDHGAAREVDATALREFLAPYLINGANGWNLRVGMSTAEICRVEELSSFMVTHVDGPEFYEVLVSLARQFDLVILAPGIPAALARAEQKQHLPNEIRHDAKLVTSGPEAHRSDRIVVGRSLEPVRARPLERCGTITPRNLARGRRTSRTLRNASPSPENNEGLALLRDLSSSWWSQGGSNP
jgi:hypothetical protein